MRTRLALLLALAIPSYAADPAASVRAAAEGWTAAAVKQDKAALDRFLADDLQYAHSGGQRQTKQEYIAAVTSGPPRYESFSFSDVTIRFYGDAAVLTGFVDVQLKGQDVFRVRTLQVYVQKSGQWQLAAHQSTRLTR